MTPTGPETWVRPSPARLRGMAPGWGAFLWFSHRDKAVHLIVVTPSSAESVLVPFPGGNRARVPMATQFRSTWLSSSLRSLRERELLDTYLGHLPPRYHESVLAPVAGLWLPIEVAVAHYKACDALALSSVDVLAIGREATNRVHGTILSTFVRLARNAGITPWMALPRMQELWARIWMGGGVSVIKLGPKEARIEIAGWPCAASPYCRIALRGVLPGIVDLFCMKSYARDLPKLATETTLGYVLSWA